MDEQLSESMGHADFTYGYRKGIWQDKTSTFEDIDHDVEIVGWGERDGKKFWKIRVSTDDLLLMHSRMAPVSTCS